MNLQVCYTCNNNINDKIYYTCKECKESLCSICFEKMILSTLNKSKCSNDHLIDVNEIYEYLSTENFSKYVKALVDLNSTNAFEQFLLPYMESIEDAKMRYDLYIKSTNVDEPSESILHAIQWRKSPQDNGDTSLKLKTYKNQIDAYITQFDPMADSSYFEHTLNIPCLLRDPEYPCDRTLRKYVQEIVEYRTCIYKMLLSSVTLTQAIGTFMTHEDIAKHFVDKVLVDGTIDKDMFKTIKFSWDHDYDYDWDRDYDEVVEDCDCEEEDYGCNRSCEEDHEWDSDSDSENDYDYDDLWPRYNIINKILINSALINVDSLITFANRNVRVVKGRAVDISKLMPSRRFPLYDYLMHYDLLLVYCKHVIKRNLPVDILYNYAVDYVLGKLTVNECNKKYSRLYYSTICYNDHITKLLMNTITEAKEVIIKCDNTPVFNTMDHLRNIERTRERVLSLSNTFYNIEDDLLKVYEMNYTLPLSVQI